MSGRRNWDRARSRDLMRRHGVEDAQHVSSLIAPLVRRRPKRRPLSKAELRDQAAQAMANYEGAIAREVRCPRCGRGGIVRIGLGHRPILRCLGCGAQS